MIPKIIHYCWFGGNPKPELAQRCIKSWKKYCFGYRIIEWNESNYDLSQAPLYVRQAYEAKKWAFVTDYVRLQVVYENGGIYVDTDVEFRKRPDSLLCNNAYFGFETPVHVATGLGFGAVKGCPILREMMKDYEHIPFCLEDGVYDTTPCPVRNTEAFVRHGLKLDGTMQKLDGGVLILPQEYLAPSGNSAEGLKITKNTISIHWFAGSWCAEDVQKEREEFFHWMKQKKMMEFLSRTGKCLLGEQFYLWLKDRVKRKK